MDREQKVLEFLKKIAGKPLKVSEIAILLDVPKNQYKDLQSILNNLISQGKLFSTPRNKYFVPDDEKYKIGTLRTNQKSFGFVKIEDSSEIFISRDNMKNAMNNDKVLVRKIKQSTNIGKNPEGKIVHIIEHGTDNVVGVFYKERNFGFVVPEGPTIIDDIYVQKKNFNSAKDGQIVVAKILQWPTDTKSAEGEIVEIIGNPDDNGIDVMTAIRAYGIPVEFPMAVIDEAISYPQEVTEDMLKGRRDLRDKTIITIDGADAKDLDDAATVEKLDNGNYKLGVHIADVSHYVKEGSKLDKEAYNRGTSVYFVDRVVPMLPEQLSNGLCSLNPQVNRLTFSVEMTFDKSGKLIDHDIFESVIRTTERMTYTDVTDILENYPKELMSRYAHIIPMLQDMEALAELLHQVRVNKGTIEFDFQESRVLINENGKAIGIEKYEMGIANQIIEEFMIATNETVAEHFYWLNKPFLYRIHEDPNDEKVEVFKSLAENMGYKLRTAEKYHPKYFQEVLEKAKGSPNERVISTVMLRSMAKARYSNVQNRHFGLGSEYYSHFTSPIRRYPDLMIHRLMKYYIKFGDQGKKERHYANILGEVADQCSDRERRAEEAERTVEDKKKVEYMKQFVGDEFDAIISGITNFGFFVELDNTCEGLVHVNTLPDYFEFNERTYSLVGELSGEVFKLGEKVKVLLAKANETIGKLDFLFIEKI